MSKTKCYQKLITIGRWRLEVAGTDILLGR